MIRRRTPEDLARLSEQWEHFCLEAPLLYWFVVIAIAIALFFFTLWVLDLLDCIARHI